MSTNTLDWVLRILVCEKEHSLASLFYFSISAGLAYLNVCSKLLFTREFANNLLEAFLAICIYIYIFLIKSWLESISSGTVLCGSVASLSQKVEQNIISSFVLGYQLHLTMLAFPQHLQDTRSWIMAEAEPFLSILDNTHL